MYCSLCIVEGKRSSMLLLFTGLNSLPWVIGQKPQFCHIFFVVSVKCYEGPTYYVLFYQTVNILISFINQ
ncbi:hypothetical protein EB796_014669 [Bugula neritina]|uniref:Uncharacterized protein n=1 Tax=Bugula neritina TaxID=10212 RepID=A0A7J7JL82_BUGNE|nr:hypothetical protein EB796_014669 [Bugula neritina]